MDERKAGTLEVGTNNGEVVVNHTAVKPDENGVGHIVFSPNQARNLAHILTKQARVADEWHEEQRIKNIPPPDRSKRCMVSGNPESIDHREIVPETGMQKDYVVLCPDERSKGFVRPVRRSYRHNVCNSVTTMGTALAETYARDPGFYSGTFCVQCREHRPLTEFVWEGTQEVLGT